MSIWLMIFKLLLRRVDVGSNESYLDGNYNGVARPAEDGCYYYGTEPTRERSPDGRRNARRSPFVADTQEDERTPRDHMSDPCSSAGGPSRSTTSAATRLSELISWRSLKKNPSGALIWAIVGASFAVNGYFWANFLMRKEYQVDRKRRMWNERVEMLENPSRMKMYYPSAESVPRPCQPLTDVYVKMREAEVARRRKIEAYARAIDAQRSASS